MNGRSARLGASDGNTTGNGSSLLRGLLLASFAKVLDNCSLHRKFDPIKGNKPNNVLEYNFGHISKLDREKRKTCPNPDNSNPPTRDGLNVGETHIPISGDEGRNELSKAECDDQRS